MLLTAKNALFTPVYGAHVLRKPWYTFYKATVPTVVSTIVIAAVCWAWAHTVCINSWLQLLASGFVVSIVYCTVAFRFLLSEQGKRPRGCGGPGAETTVLSHRLVLLGGCGSNENSTWSWAVRILKRR